jgi:hypothetical protein
VLPKNNFKMGRTILLLKGILLESQLQDDKRKRKKKFIVDKWMDGQIDESFLFFFFTVVNLQSH